MKIIHLINAIDNLATGPTNSVTGLCSAQIKMGLSVKLISLNWGFAGKNESYVEKFPFTFIPHKLGFSRKMYKGLLKAANDNEKVVMHSHNVWSMQGYYPYLVRKKFPNSRFVLSPHGALSEYSLSIGSRLKPIYWKLLQKPALDGADCLHATSVGEYEDIRRLGIKVPVAIIANGVDAPAEVVRPAEDSRTFTYLGRIHPEKGLEALLEAWGMLGEGAHGWNLRIVGPDPVGYRERLKSIAAARGLRNISFGPPVLGDAKVKLFGETEVLILPSPSENFGMVVAEAMAAEVPVITTDGTPWRDLAVKRAGWYCGTSASSLAVAMKSASETGVLARRAMGSAGRAWVQESFGLRKVAGDMASTYEWLLGEASMPACVRID